MKGVVRPREVLREALRNRCRRAGAIGLFVPPLPFLFSPLQEHGTGGIGEVQPFFLEALE